MLRAFPTPNSRAIHLQRDRSPHGFPPKALTLPGGKPDSRLTGGCTGLPQRTRSPWGAAQHPPLAPPALLHAWGTVAEDSFGAGGWVGGSLLVLRLPPRVWRDGLNTGGESS